MLLHSQTLGLLGFCTFISCTCGALAYMCVPFLLQ